jgi:hypothetical protein
MLKIAYAHLLASDLDRACAFFNDDVDEFNNTSLLNSNCSGGERDFGLQAYHTTRVRVRARAHLSSSLSIAFLNLNAYAWVDLSARESSIPNASNSQAV